MNLLNIQKIEKLTKTQKELIKQEDLVTPEQAKSLLKLGFNYGTEYYQSENGQLIRSIHYVNWNGWRKNCINPDEYLSIPRLYQAQKWLRKEKKYSVEPFSSLEKGKYTFEIIDVNTGFDYKSYKTLSYKFDSYEEALSAGIDECIKILENGEIN